MAGTATPWKDYVEVATRTDIGLRRTNNQDSLCVSLAPSHERWQQQGHLFMVADGMGAHAAGELASELACGGVPHTYQKLAQRPAAEALRQAIEETNNQIHARGQSNSEFHGMGTTSSVLVLLPQGAVAGHVGDSRVYRLRESRLEQLTFDHSLLWEVMAAGQATRPDTACFIPKNIITRSLGPNPNVQVDLEGPFDVRRGDVFLVCSDGLTGQVTDGEIAQVLALLSPAEAVQVLVDLANLRGGPDNTSVVVVRVVADPPPPQEINETETSQRSLLGKMRSEGWLGIALCSVAGITFATFEQWPLAAICGGMALLAGWLGLVPSAPQGDLPSSSRDIVAPLGRGPHVTVDAPVDQGAVEKFAEAAEQLKQAAVQQGRTLDWASIDSGLTTAANARQQGDFSASARGYLLAIRDIMGGLRQQRGNNDPTSVLPLN